MKKIKCLLVDDEHLAVSLLEKYVLQTPDLEILEKCKSPIRAVELLQSETVDLLFLDIQMPILSGTNLLRSVSKKPVTIFTTAYPQHAVEAFGLDAIDYLLKPYSYERFEQAVHKARQWLHAKSGQIDEALEGALVIKADRKWIKIPFSDILYVEGWKEYVKIYTTTEKIITLERLNHLESTLPSSHFMRVHKSFIVAQHRVQKMDGDDLILGAARIPVARARKKEVIDAFFKN
jgi:DNA-binding LytR/AlgR family response regulator